MCRPTNGVLSTTTLLYSTLLYSTAHACLIVFHQTPPLPRASAPPCIQGMQNSVNHPTTWDFILIRLLSPCCCRQGLSHNSCGQCSQSCTSLLLRFGDISVAYPSRQAMHFRAQPLRHTERTQRMLEPCFTRSCLGSPPNLSCHRWCVVFLR